MRTAVVNIGQLATCGLEPWTVDVHENVSLTFADGIVQSVSETADADEVVDAGGGVVLPGFIDAHTHLVFGGTRANELEWRAQGLGYQEISARGGGIRSTVAKTRALDSQGLLQAGLTHLTWCLQLGTTTFETKSGYGLNPSTEIDILLAIHQMDEILRHQAGQGAARRVFATFLGLHSVDPDKPDRVDYVRQMLYEVLPAVCRSGLADYADAFIEPGYFDHEDARALAAKAGENGIGLRLHVDQLSPNGGAEVAAGLGAVTADHLEQTDWHGIAALSGSGTIPVLLPGSVLGLGLSKYAAAREMIDAGLPVVLATDFNPGSSPTPSIPFVMALANRMMRMTPAECLAAVTVNAAATLGLTDRGRLAAGQLADFSVWPVKDWREVACWLDGPRPVQVWANGTRLI